MGEPGGGKTTCLKRLALDAHIAYAERQEVVIFVPLARWLAGGGLWGLIHRCTGLSLSQVEYLIHKGRCRLLLDAINECPDSLRPAAMAEIAALLRQYPQLPVVLSARTKQDPVGLGLPTFVVQPMGRAQQEHFLSAYLLQPEVATELLNRIHAQPGGELLAANPLLLRMIVEVVGKKGDLPQGRAGLYRHWIELWYRREQTKARNANFELPWRLDRVRSALAAIAFTARQAGQRLADLDMAHHALANQFSQEETALFLDHMTQGPLIQREDECIRFRHETFQEYLCAEALLSNPDALASSSKNDYATWGMSIAYAAELQDPLPPALMNAVWRIEPWLGAVLWSEGMPLPDLEEPLMGLIRWATEGGMPDDYAKSQSKIIKLLYRPDDILRYGITTHTQREIRWKNFEAERINLAWHPGMVQGQIGKMLTPGHVLRGLINRPLTTWIEEANVFMAANLVESGLASLEDFTCRKSEWMSHPSNKEIVALIKMGWMPINIDHSTPELIVNLIKSGLMSADDFASRRAKWIVNATPKQACLLIESGLMTAKEFSSRKAEWVTKAKWFVHATPKQACLLIESGLMTADEFASRKAEWTTSATPNQAAFLIKSGLMTADEFASRKAELFAKPNQSLTTNKPVTLPPSEKLSDPHLRNKLLNDLRQTKIQAKVTSAIGNSYFLDTLTKNPQTIICHYSDLTPGTSKLEVGDTVCCKIGLWECKTMPGSWDYVGLEVECIRPTKTESSTPNIDKVTPTPSSVLASPKTTATPTIPRKINPSDLGSTWPRIITPLMQYLLGDSTKLTIFRQRLPQKSPLAEWLPNPSERPAIKTAMGCIDRIKVLGYKPTSKDFEAIALAFQHRGHHWQALCSLAEAHLCSLGYAEEFKAALLNLTTPKQTHLPISKPAPQQELPQPSIKQATQQELPQPPASKHSLPPQPAQSSIIPHDALTWSTPPTACHDAWGRLLQAWTSSNAQSRDQALESLQDHYKGKGWSGQLPTQWTPSKSEANLLKKMDTLRKQIFAASPARRPNLLSQLCKEMTRLHEQASNCRMLARLYFLQRGIDIDMSRDSTAKIEMPQRILHRNVEKKVAPISLGIIENNTPKSDFVLSASTISIFIDEVELGTEKGAIAGIVWNGPTSSVPSSRLSTIRTHLKKPEPLNELLNCPDAFPFVVPVNVGQGVHADYLTMVRTTIQILLGWLLPIPVQKTSVEIHLELYSQYKIGDQTSFFAGALEEAKVDDPLRYGNWTITLVQWQSKDFGYLAWGDLLGYWYLSQVVRHQKFGYYDCTILQGYLPVDEEGYRNIRAVSRKPTPEGILDLACSLGDCHLARVLMKELRRQCRQDATLGQGLLVELDRRYHLDVRDLRNLKPQLRAVKTLVQPIDEQSTLAVKLLMLVLDLQDANHDGDPQRVLGLEERYLTMRSKALDLNHDLVAHLDANLAVHASDRADFSHACEVLEWLIGDQRFLYLTPLSRGRHLSSLGQQLAIAGSHFEAEAQFAKALELFDGDPSLTPSQLARERSQTMTYRTINALDGGLEKGRIFLRELLGGDPASRIEDIMLGNESSRINRQYHHHVLLRHAWFSNDVELSKAILKHKNKWDKLIPQHPWELIGLYRGLLILRDGRENADLGNQFMESLQVVQFEEGGSAMDMIRCVIAMVGAVCTDDSGLIGLARQYLSRLAVTIGADNSIHTDLHQGLISIENLPKKIGEDDLIELINRIITVLPFNYR